MKNGWRHLLIFLLVLGGVWVLSPHSSTVAMEIEAVEYKLDDPAYARPRTVTMEGTYIRRLLGEDSYRGTLAVSGPESAQPPHEARVSFFNGNWASVTYVDDQFLHKSEEISALFATPKFEQAIFLLYEVEARSDGGQSAGWNGSTGRFLAYATQSRAEAVQFIDQVQTDLFQETEKGKYFP